MARRPMTREERVVANADKSSQKAITLSSGVVLRVKRVPVLVISEVLKTFKKPSVPFVFIEDLGRSEENPNDPAYLTALEEWTQERDLAMVDLFMVAGTEVVEIPRSVAKPEDDEWLETLNALGVPTPTNKKLRYLMWIKNVAAVTNEDIQSIMEAVSRESGASEADVKDALDNFRN